MVSQDYVDALVDFGSTLQAGEVAPLPGVLTLNGQILQTKKMALFATIDADQGAVMTTVSLGGQTATRNVPMTLLDQYAAYKQAIDILTGNQVRTTYARFF